MFRPAKINTGTLLGLTLTTLALSLPVHAYQDSYGGMGSNSGSGSGSGMGMGMGSGSGYSGSPGYYGGSGYDYQRPPRPPMRPYDYQRPPMRPYGYERPPMRPMPPMRPYRSERTPMRPYGSGSERSPMLPMRPYGSERPPMPPMRPYGYRAAPMAPADAAPESSSQADAATAEVSVNIQGMAYQPASLTIKIGTKVTWTNNDRAPHTVTSMDSGPLASGSLNFGDSYSMTFNEPGTYTYYCKFHPRMRASVIVE